MCDYWDTQLPENVSFDTVLQSAELLRQERDDLLAACEAGKQFVAKYVADTDSVIAQRALDKMEAAIARARGE